MRPEQYVYIAAWGYRLGSQQYYIRAAQEKALEDHAPADALYRRDYGTWYCRSDVSEHQKSLLDRLDRLAGKVGGG